MKKWNSRKLFSIIVGAVVAWAAPDLAPLLGKIVPTYVGIQGIVDAVKAWKATQE